jgi:hypothetical protein
MKMLLLPYCVKRMLDRSLTLVNSLTVRSLALPERKIVSHAITSCLYKVETLREKLCHC